ncbi:hypothetical protein CRUP_021212 [Coryphaenoides rupestris]|nr:hypothetical protein CRUP_021212 [Coryphaenoides rupestris]
MVTSLTSTTILEPLTGLVSRGPRALDRETISSHMLEVEAYNSDHGRMRSSVRVSPVRHQGGTVLEVEAYNSDHGRMRSSVRQYNRLGLRETAGIGTSVIVVRATDSDTGDGGAVSYAIVSGSDRKFQVDVSTGLVTTVDHLDYETKTSYLMNVSATDQAPPFHRGFCAVYVTLLNELDEAVAFFSAGYEASLPESTATGTEVVQVRAQSADNLNQLTYRFDPDTSPAALALFRIDSVTRAMNTSDPGGFNTSSLVVGSTPPTTPTMQGPALPGLTTTLSLSLSTPSASPSEAHDPGVTIMVVLGLAALLAGVAAFLAVCRSSKRGGGGRDSEGGGGQDSEGGGGGGFFFCGSRGDLGDSGRGSRAVTSEPQLKVWKRLGSYRRSYNRSFRRPPPPPQHRRPPEAQSPVGGPGSGGGGGSGSGGGPAPARRSHAGQTPLRPESCRAEPHAATPCLFDYVTEI